MTRLVGLLCVSLLLASACSDPPRPSLSEETLPVVPAFDEGTGTDESPEDGGSAVQQGDTTPRVLITPTGVVVPVI